MEKSNLRFSFGIVIFIITYMPILYIVKSNELSSLASCAYLISAFLLSHSLYNVYKRLNVESIIKKSNEYELVQVGTSYNTQLYLFIICYVITWGVFLFSIYFQDSDAINELELLNRLALWVMILNIVSVCSYNKPQILIISEYIYIDEKQIEIKNVRNSAFVKGKIELEIKKKKKLIIKNTTSDAYQVLKRKL